MKLLSTLLITLVLAPPAFAYIGPGAGLGAVGALVAVVGGLLLLMVGFLWYPLKRLMRGRHADKKTESSSEGETTEEAEGKADNQ